MELLYLSQVVKRPLNFINSVRGQNLPVNIAALKYSFGDLIVDHKKIAEHFNLIFSNLGQYFGGEYEGALIYKAGDESFSLCPIKEKDCYGILKQKILTNQLALAMYLLGQ